MEKETIGLKAIIMFDMLHVLLNMTEICTKLQYCHSISSHVFDHRFFRHIRSRNVMFYYTPVTKFNRVDMYCVVPIGAGATYRKNCFFPFAFLKNFQTSGVANFERNLAEI